MCAADADNEKALEKEMKVIKWVQFIIFVMLQVFLHTFHVSNDLIACPNSKFRNN
jgi:hypothetical protein